ncbi:MAG: EAL domain-containing protein [Halofilum sp. (in: g-proteobacteria)]
MPTEFQAFTLSVVAEGVESPGQMQGLQQLGYDLLQGSYFARPMPRNKSLEWVRATA